MIDTIFNSWGDIVGTTVMSVPFMLAAALFFFEAIFHRVI
jgi:ABC-type molybdate transport system permease subunit